MFRIILTVQNESLAEMASKLCVVFMLLFVCQATLSARIPRESDVTTTPSSNFQSTTTSEESSEEFEKIKADFEKTLNKKEQEEFNQIVACVQSAKTLDESLTSVFKLIEFGIKTSSDQMEKYYNSTTPPTDTNRI